LIKSERRLSQEARVTEALKASESLRKRKIERARRKLDRLRVENIGQQKLIEMQLEKLRIQERRERST
jgi:hypothetical protein